MSNKKILNATPLEYNDIKFKSRLEVMIYKTLSQAGFDVKYESYKYIIWKGFKPNVPFYTKDKTSRMLKLDDKKLIDITYTPDFTFIYKNLFVIVEAKGFQNDVYPYKKKLFRDFLEHKSLDGGINELTPIYFEIYTKKQLMQAIEIIKYHELTNINTTEDNSSS